MSDVECPRCHRISFAWESNSSCVACHWTIRPSSVDKPYGCDVLVETRATNLGTAAQVRHYKGNEKTARRRARLVPGFVQVLAVVPLSKATWLSCYGEGRM